MLKLLGGGAFVCALAAFTSLAAGLPARSINGNYIETRTADVYTGPCFANGEVGMAGREAVFGWKINNGEWHGVSLEGLSVVGVIRTGHTRGEVTPPANPATARAVEHKQ